MGNAEKISRRHGINDIVNGIFCGSSYDIGDIGVVDNTAGNTPSGGRIAVNIVHKFNRKFIVAGKISRQAWMCGGG